MQDRRWVRPLLAFLIAFGVVAMVGAMLRVIVVYRHLFSLGMAPDDPSVASAATRELSRLDHMYTPAFLLVAVLVSGAVAGVFALWRPKAKAGLPPPLPAGR